MIIRLLVVYRKYVDLTSSQRAFLVEVFVAYVFVVSLALVVVLVVVVVVSGVVVAVV